MEKKINLSKFIFPLAFVLGIISSSCLDDFNRYSYYHDDLASSLGIVETNSSDQSFVINLDNGSVVTPSSVLPGYTPTDSDRVWIRFYPLSQTSLTDSTFNYVGRIHSINDILFKDVKPLSEVSEDSVGHDPIIVRSAWISPKDILNIEFKFFREGSIHYINLLDNGEGDGVTNPYILEFRHNARGDMNLYPVTGTVSFKLNSLRVQGQDHVQFFIRYTDYEGNRIDMPKTYYY